ncbi:MAG: 6-carboxytetrahydropterin synthase QueD [Planctomycetota bacterium]|jgi:6-pyruvoyltetrahydropterin/6-carboxytetrahydropterin synthase
MKVSKEFSFDAAHNLKEYQGKCEALHGHTYRLRITVEIPVGPTGMAFDFVDLKRIVEDRVISVLDHTYLNDTLRQPTAENLAIWIWDTLSELPLWEVRVWETPDSFVAYGGPEA